MNKLGRHLCLLVAACTALPAFADPATDALSTCLVDHTSGRDRKDLARWVILAMAVHPETRPMFSITPEARDGADRVVGRLFQRLVTVDCAEQMRAATHANGELAIKSAFSNLGQVAVQELMSDPQVQASMSGFTKYIDRDAVNKALQ